MGCVPTGCFYASQGLLRTGFGQTINIYADQRAQQLALTITHIDPSEPLRSHLVSHVGYIRSQNIVRRINGDNGLRPLRAVQFVQQLTTQILFLF